MSTSPEPTLRSVFSVGEDTLRRSWGWLLAFGIILIIVGLFALSTPFIFSLYFTLYAGFVLIASGVVHSIQAFRTRTWGGFFLALFTAILDLVVGFIMVLHATDAVAIMTFLLAAYFFVGGLFRIF